MYNSNVLFGLFGYILGSCFVAAVLITGPVYEAGKKALQEKEIKVEPVVPTILINIDKSICKPTV